VGGKETFVKRICVTQNVVRSCTKQGLAFEWRALKKGKLQCKIICANKTILPAVLLFFIPIEVQNFTDDFTKIRLLSVSKIIGRIN
jgi:hypothetical protein